MFLFKKWKPFVHPFYNLKKQSDPWLTNLGCQQRFCEIDDLTCENRFFRQCVLVWISRHITPEAPLSAPKSAIAENGMGVNSRP